MWQNVDINSHLVRRAAGEFVDFVNKYNSKYSRLCQTLRLADVYEAAKLLPNKRVLSFKGSVDADGHMPDLSSKIRLTSELFQIKVGLTPGGGLFEFSSIYDINADRFIFQVRTHAHM